MAYEYIIKSGCSDTSYDHYHSAALSDIQNALNVNIPKSAYIYGATVYLDMNHDTVLGTIGNADVNIWLCNNGDDNGGLNLCSGKSSTNPKEFTANFLPYVGSRYYPFTLNSSYPRLAVYYDSTTRRKYRCDMFKVIFDYYILQYNITLGSSEGGYAYTIKDGHNTTGTIQLERGSSITIKAQLTNSGYRFVKWDDGVTSIERTITASGDITYTPIFERIKVIATFKNEDVVLQTSELFYGETPSYTGSTPVKKSSVQYHYSFSGWSKTIGAITSDTVYEAQFTSTLREYQINLVCTPSESGDTVALIGAGTYKYGETITLRPEGIPPYHEFSHWLKYNGDTSTYIYSNPFITIVDEGLIGDGSETSVTLYCNFKHTGYNVRARILPESSMGIIELCKVSIDANGTKIYEKIDIIPNEDTVNIKYSERNGCYAFRAVPNAKYKFVKWNDDKVENPREIIVSVSSNKVYAAVFELDRINQILVDLSQSELILVDLEEADKIYADEVKTYG